MKTFILIAISCIALSACEYNKEVESLKSPCVGIGSSPCGDKRPANPHMMEAYSIKV